MATGKENVREVIDGVRGAFQRYIYFEDDLYYSLCPIYVLLTHVYSVFDAVPYIQIYGPKGTGKSRLGEIFEGLCFDPIVSSEISTPYLYRAIDEKVNGTTFLVDEADDLSNSKRYNPLLRILRSSYRRTGNVGRCNAKREATQINTFCPKIIINIEGLFDPALESRTIPIPMTKSEVHLEKFRFSKAEREFKEIRSFIGRFTEECKDVIANHYESFQEVEGISDRDEEIWAPIFVIAEVLDAALDEPCMKTAMVTLAKKIILERKRMQLIGNTEAQILEGTRAYIDEVEPVKIGGLSFYVGEDLSRSIRDRWDLTGLKTETVSRALKRNALIVGGPRRPRLPNKGQRTCYVLNTEKLAKITAEYFDGAVTSSEGEKE